MQQPSWYSYHLICFYQPRTSLNRLGRGTLLEYGLQPHNGIIIVDFFSKINFFPVHDLAEHHSRRCTGDRCQQRGTCDGRRIDAAVLAAVGDHVDGNELE